MKDQYVCEGQLTKQEKEEVYPLLCKMLGSDNFNIHRMTGMGMGRAHMVFTPDIEGILKKSVQEELWNEFKIQVSILKKPRPAKATRSK